MPCVIMMLLLFAYDGTTGRVLVGLLVKPSDTEDFEAFLKNLGYTHYDETTNEAYTQFLL